MTQCASAVLPAQRLGCEAVCLARNRALTMATSCSLSLTMLLMILVAVRSCGAQMGTLNTTEEMAENCTQPHLQDIREMLLEFNRTGDRERLCRAMNVRLEYGSAALKQKDISLCSDLAQLFRVGCLDHAELASLLLCAGLPVNSPDHDGGTLLHGAAACGRLAMARWLVARGAHVDAVGLYEWTPLMYAAENGHLEMVRYLVQVGANTTIRDEDGYNALYYARAPEVERYLEQLPQ